VSADRPFAQSAELCETTSPSPPEPRSTDRDPQTGRFAPGNAVARKHGLHSSALTDALREEREAFLAASIVDDGGESEVTTRRRSLLDYRARLHVQIIALSDALERFGMFDRRGRLRSGWLQRLEALIGRGQAIDATLGLGRRERHVPTAHELIRGDRS